MDQATHEPTLRCPQDGVVGTPVTATDQKGLDSTDAVIGPINGQARNSPPAIKSIQVNDAIGRSALESDSHLPLAA
jgi:hypothetical protein